MDAAQWPQEVGLVEPVEEITSATSSRPLMERRVRPQTDQPLNCPRCNSTNTKFCYYNNYSLTQPRYFCKACRRYWTEGGSLRNVPVGGGSRKNKRSSSSASSSASSKKAPDLTPPKGSLSSSQNPKICQGQDLNLAFQTTQDYNRILEFVQLPNIGNNSNNNTAPSSSPSSSLSVQEMLSGVSSRGLNSFMSMPLAMPNTSAVYPSGFGLHDLKPTHSFPFDGFGGGYGSIQGVQESSGRGRLLFPHGDLKPVPNTDFEQNKGQGDASGYWNWMLGGGSW